MALDILLAAYGGGHVNIIIPIRRLLLERGHKVHVLGLTMAREKLTRNNIAFLGYKDFLDNNNAQDREALEIGDRLSEGMPTNAAIPRSETSAYMGICYQELVADLGDANAARAYAEKGRQAFLPRRFARRVLAQLSPDALITTNSPRTEKALLLEAQSAGIFGTCVVDFFDESEIEDRLGLPDYGNLMCVSFSSFREKLIAAGRNAQDVVVAGNPALDYLASEPTDMLRAQMRRNLGWEGKRVLLWAKSAMPALATAEREVEEMLFAYSASTPDTVLSFRPHPNDPSSYAELDEKGVHVSRGDEPLLAALSASDVVITINSTVGLEANLLGKEVIQTNFVAFDEHVPFQQLGIGIEVRNRDELASILGKGAGAALLSPCMQVGKAAETIANLLEARLCPGPRHQQGS